jgi:hypothetical protein
MQFYTKVITGTGVMAPLTSYLSDNQLNRNPKKILIIIPTGHKLYLQQVQGTQWSANGEVIEIHNSGTGPSILFEIINFENDEAGISPNSHSGYSNLQLYFKVGETGYLFVSY